jgi:hypothetical protein
MQLEEYAVRRGHKWSPRGNAYWKRTLAYCRAEYNIALAMYAVCAPSPPRFRLRLQVYCIMVDSKALSPPADAPQRWDLLMKPFAKVKSPAVPPWSTVQLVLSPTKRPLPGLDINPGELDLVTIFNKYVFYISMQITSSNSQVASIRDLEGPTAVAYIVGEEELATEYDLSKSGSSFTMVSRFEHISCLTTSRPG